MKIRNIIPTAAIAIVLGLTGASAFAGDATDPSHMGFLASPDASYPGQAVVYEGDAGIGENEVAAIVQFEESEADVQGSLPDALDVN